MKRKEEQFILVSLDEKESKQLAQVISNNSSRKILSYLTKKNATESEISKNLNIPISTVHYNLKQLIKSKLIDSKEYHYSKKGKEVNHYSLSKKYIIIAPSTSGIKTKLKHILPMAVIAGAAALIIQFASSVFRGASFGVQKSAEIMHLTDQSLEVAEPAAIGECIKQMPIPASVWFLFGGIAVIVVYLIIILIKKK